MPEFTTNQWAILFLVLVLGWLLGLISRSGGRKWKRAYEAERDARIDEQRALETAHARIVELESARPAIVTPAPVAPVAPVVAPVVPAAPVATADPLATTSTLDLTRDDLARIRGVGVAGQRRLNDEGIYRYSDITGMTTEEEADLERKLGADEGYIEQERWREQAALLAEGRLEDHRDRFA